MRTSTRSKWILLVLLAVAVSSVALVTVGRGRPDGAKTGPRPDEKRIEPQRAVAATNTGFPEVQGAPQSSASSPRPAIDCRITGKESLASPGLGTRIVVLTMACLNIGEKPARAFRAEVRLEQVLGTDVLRDTFECTFPADAPLRQGESRFVRLGMVETRGGRRLEQLLGTHEFTSLPIPRLSPGGRAGHGRSRAG